MYSVGHHHSQEGQPCSRGDGECGNPFLSPWQHFCVCLALAQLGSLLPGWGPSHAGVNGFKRCAGFWRENEPENMLLHLLTFSAAGMRCKMLELLQTHWWRTSSLCLRAFSWARKNAFPLQLKQALTLHLDLQLQVCSLSGQHSNVEEMEQSWIQFILFKTWKNSNSNGDQAKQATATIQWGVGGLDNGVQI